MKFRLFLQRRLVVYNWEKVFMASGFVSKASLKATSPELARIFVRHPETRTQNRTNENIYARISTEFLFHRNIPYFLINTNFSPVKNLNSPRIPFQIPASLICPLNVYFLRIIPDSSNFVLFSIILYNKFPKNFSSTFAIEIIYSLSSSLESIKTIAHFACCSAWFVN